MITWRKGGRGVREQGSREAGEQGSRGAGEHGCATCGGSARLGSPHPCAQPHLDTTIGCLGGVRIHPCRCSMRRHDRDLEGDVELQHHIRGGLHGRQVRIAAHDDANLRRRAVAGLRHALNAQRGEGRLQRPHRRTDERNMRHLAPLPCRRLPVPVNACVRDRERLSTPIAD